MKICVLVKQVPDPEEGVVFDPESRWLCPAGGTWVMNSYDGFAVEEALRLKESLEGASVEAVTLGPERAGTVVRRALAMGCDSGVHVRLARDHRPGLSRTASLLSGVLKEKAHDLILCGVQSQDEQAGAVGPMTARALGIPCVSGVVELSLPQDGSLEVSRESEGGILESLRLPLPALVTVQSTGRKPRYPSLSNVLRANRARVPEISEEELAPGISPDAPFFCRKPGARSRAEILSGSAEEKARVLARIFSERGLL